MKEKIMIIKIKQNFLRHEKKNEIMSFISNIRFMKIV